MDQFLRQIQEIAQPTPEEWAEFALHVTVKSFGKGELLVRRGGRCTELFLLISGITRHYLLDQEGEEVTTWFSQSGGFVTDYAAFTTGQETQFEIEAMSAVEAWSISKESLELLYNRSKTWERLGRLVNQTYVIELIERNNRMIQKTARERFEEFFGTHGSLFNEISLKYIASYLNMSLETLSRLRSGKYG